MTAFPYRRTQNSATGLTQVVAFNAANPAKAVYETSSKHPHFEAIIAGLDAGDDSVWELFDVVTGIMSKFNSITDRVSYDGSNIRFDGDVRPDLISKQILRALESGSQDYAALAKFWEKLESNPNAHSREQAYAWLATHDFKITQEGDLVTYKGVHPLTDDYGSITVDGYSSISSGTAYVNGEIKTGRIPQDINDEVTMPRSEVQWDPYVGCHKGLHVGDWSYASDFGSVVLEVHVNPRDIVSVPTDCGARKMRVCRYRVVREVTAEYGGKAPVLSGATTGWAGTVGYAG